MKLQINNKQNIFFCSDPHYGHAGIVRGTSTWEGKRGCRDFDTLEEHDQTLVDNINKTVGENDILFCLGDWSFGGYKTGDNVTNIKKFRDQIICKNVHLILGNHDGEIRKNKNGEQELFSSISPYLEVLIIDQPKEQGEVPLRYNIVMCHYAMRVWNKSFRGSWMLYGHSHGNLDEFTPLTANPDWIGDQYYTKSYRTMDVGFDTHPEFRPYSFQELKEIMERRNVTIEVDHHNGERE
jgi:calcineurin-like phosphoesterase family protein